MVTIRRSPARALSLGLLVLLVPLDARAQVLWEIQSSGKTKKEVTAGVAIDDQFYFATWQKEKVSVFNAAEPTVNQWIGFPKVSGVDVGRGKIHSLAHLEGQIWAATETGLWSRGLRENKLDKDSQWASSLSEPCGLPVVGRDVLCIALGTTANWQGYRCFDSQGTPRGPSNDTTVLQRLDLIDDRLWISNGSQIDVMGLDGVKGPSIQVGGIISGLLETEDTVWVRTNLSPGYPFAVYRLEKSSLSDPVKPFQQLELQKLGGVTSFERVRHEVWLGTLTGKVLRVTEDLKPRPLRVLRQDSRNPENGKRPSDFHVHSSVQKISYLTMGEVFIQSKNAYLLRSTDNLLSEFQQRPVLGEPKKNSRLRIKEVDETSSLWLWNQDHLYQLDWSLSLRLRPNLLFEKPLIWGPTLRIDAKRTGYFRNAVKVEMKDGERDLGLPFEITTKHQEHRVGSSRGENDPYYWAKIEHFDHPLRYHDFKSLRVGLRMKDAYGNVAERAPQFYFPILPTLQIIPIYIILSFVGNLFFLALAGFEFPRKLWLRSFGKLFALSPYFTLFAPVRGRLIRFYRKRLRESLKPPAIDYAGKWFVFRWLNNMCQAMKGFWRSLRALLEQTVQAITSLVGWIEGSEPCPSAQGESKHLIQSLRKPRTTKTLLVLHSESLEKLKETNAELQLVLLSPRPFWLRWWNLFHPPATPVEVDLRTATENGSSFLETARRRLLTYGVLAHPTIADQILDGSNVVFFITGFDTNIDRDGSAAKLFWALKHAYSGYGRQHDFVVFCHGKKPTESAKEVLRQELDPRTVICSLDPEPSTNSSEASVDST